MCTFRIQVFEKYLYSNTSVRIRLLLILILLKLNIITLKTIRCESKETILASLSEESKTKRRRRNKIGIQITFISWILEFLGGTIVLLRYLLFQTHNGGEWLDRLFALFDFFFCIVLVPLSYLLNDEAVKVAIEVKGWSKVLNQRNQIQ